MAGGTLARLTRTLLVVVVAASLSASTPSAASDQNATVDGGSDAYADAGSAVETHSFYSAALERGVPYVVYTPPGYGRGARRYPVLYMLHGMGGSYTQWKNLGLFDAADAMIRARTIAPLLIVLPQGDSAYWMDHAGADRAAWGTYTSRDLVAEIDARYRTLAGPAHRAIGGLSMGAHGAVQLALNHPDVFGIAGAHSLVLRRFDQAFPFFGNAQQYAERDPLSIVSRAPDAAARIALWVDIGDRDPWAARTYQFADKLASQGISFEWNAWRGEHSGEYWSGHLADYLRFYDRALRGGASHGRVPRAAMEMVAP